MIKKYIHELLFRCGTLILAIAIPCATRITTWCLIMLMLNWLLEGHLKQKIKRAYSHPFVIVCSLLYMVELCGLFFTHHLQREFYHVQTEASFLVIPLLYMSQGRLSRPFAQTTVRFFCASVFLSSLYCLGVGCFHYFHSDDITFLFYHPLVAPIHQHAVYFSVYTFICIVFLFHELKQKKNNRIGGLLFLLIYFSVLLFFLRSKMVTGIALVYGIFQLIKIIRSYDAGERRAVLYPVILITGIILALLTSNPLSHQVQDLETSHLEKLSRKEFDPGVYFNGIELRLLLWKFSQQILQEQKAWLTGITAGDAREHINEKILAANMYTGQPGTTNTGYLNYNLHNQYLETLFLSGITGLLLLLTLLFILIRKAIRFKEDNLLFTVMAFALFFTTESVFERQIGVIPFFFFASLWVAALEGDPWHDLKTDKKKNKLRIFVDAHSFDKGYQGVCTFIRGLYSNLFFAERVVLYLGAYDTNNLKKIFPHIPQKQFITYHWRHPFMRLLIETPYILYKYRFDYAHFQYIIPPLRFGKCIVTTHDILFRDFKKDFPFFYRVARNIAFKYSIKNADIKTTPSEYTRQRLSFYYGISKDEIRVIPNGVSDDFVKLDETRHAAIDYIGKKFGIFDFILCVSRVEPRKNQALLLQSYLELALHQKDISLVFIGNLSLPDVAFTKAWSAIPPYAKKYIRHFYSVSQSDLLMFYRAARLFVFPSRAEGAGIPPLEAAAIKTPVLCANGGAMSAYTFFGENLFDPGNEILFRQKLEKMVSIGTCSASLNNLSEIVRNRYSWDKSVRYLWHCL